MKIRGWHLFIVVALGLATLPAVTAAAPADTLYITTTNTAESVERALQELGYAYDYYFDTTGNWTGIDLSPYDVVIVGMDGGRIGQASIQTVRADVIDAGKRLIFLGGTDWADFALGVNQYLVLNEVDNHPRPRGGGRQRRRWAQPHLQG